MARIKLNPVRRMLGIVIALALAGAFFSLLGAAPGYENLFKALMMVVLLSIAVVAWQALTEIKSRTAEVASRQFQNITLKKVCQ